MDDELRTETREWLVLGLLIGVGVGYRALIWVGLGRVLDSADAVHYVTMARQFAGGGFTSFDPRIPVLYPLLCAAANAAFPDIETACRVVSLVCSVLLILPVYWLAKDLHGREAATIAALVCATWTWLADYASRVAPESLAVLMWVLGVWLLYRGLRDGGLALGLAAVAFFALNLTRPEGFVLLLAAPFGGAILIRGAGRRGRRRLAVFTVLCATLLLSDMVVMGSITGHMALSYRAGSLGATAHYLSNRWVELGKTFSKVLTEVIPVMLGPFFLLFGGVGLFRSGAKRRNARLETYVLYFVCVQLAAAVLSTYPEPRYTMAALVVFMLWSARGMALVAEQARAAGFGRFVSTLPVTVMLGFMVFGTATVLAPQWLGRMPRDPVEYKTTGLWMKAHLPPGLILTRKPEVGYYAGMPTFGPSATATVGTVRSEAEAAGARYVVIDERYTASMAPGLKPLLDPSRPAPRGLKLVKAGLSPYPGARIVIYEVVGTSGNGLASGKGQETREEHKASGSAGPRVK